MVQRPQTSVRIATGALEALRVIAKRRGVSREEAVRQLLREYIEAQSVLEEEKRLTHISTVLRYPPPAVGCDDPDHRLRLARRLDDRVRLAMRLDEGVAERARELAFRLPGQAAGRAHQDYQARPLTDAVVTAIASKEPFVDVGLEGLPPLLRWRTARGLWRLTNAATRGRAELGVLLGGESSQDVEDMLREEEVAWHDPWRCEVALHLARQLFIDPLPGEDLAMVDAQTEEFNAHCFDLERVVELDHRWLKGLPMPGHNVQGRSGSAVWRAQRTVAIEALARWLTNAGPGAVFTVDPPGWDLQVPAGWHGHHLRYGATLSASLQADLDAGRLLQVASGAGSVLWPLDVAGQPIPGIEAVVCGAGNVTPAALVETILVERRLYGPPDLYVPAAQAHALGFITQAERDRLVSEATERTAARVRAALRKAERLDEPARLALHEAAATPDRFVKLAARSGIRCSVKNPTWRWRVGPVTEALSAGTPQDRLRWLAATTARVLGRYLEGSMESAWHEALRRGQPQLGEPV